MVVLSQEIQLSVEPCEVDCLQLVVLLSVLDNAGQQTEVESVGEQPQQPGWRGARCQPDLSESLANLVQARGPDRDLGQVALWVATIERPFCWRSCRSRRSWLRS